jgi:hypothetical protein
MASAIGMLRTVLVSIKGKGRQSSLSRRDQKLVPTNDKGFHCVDPGLIQIYKSLEIVEEMFLIKQILVTSFLADSVWDREEGLL